METNDDSQQEQAPFESEASSPGDAEERIRRELRSVLAEVEILGQQWREVLDFIPIPALDEEMLAGDVEPDFLHTARSAMECAEHDHLAPLHQELQKLLDLDRLNAPEEGC